MSIWAVLVSADNGCALSILQLRLAVSDICVRSYCVIGLVCKKCPITLVFTSCL